MQEAPRRVEVEHAAIDEDFLARATIRIYRRVEILQLPCVCKAQDMIRRNTGCSKAMLRGHIHRDEVRHPFFLQHGAKRLQRQPAERFVRHNPRLAETIDVNPARTQKAPHQLQFPRRMEQHEVIFRVEKNRFEIIAVLQVIFPDDQHRYDADELLRISSRKDLLRHLLLISAFWDQDEIFLLALHDMLHGVHGQSRASDRLLLCAVVKEAGDLVLQPMTAQAVVRPLPVASPPRI